MAAPMASGRPLPLKLTRRVLVLLAALALSVLLAGLTAMAVARIDDSGVFVRWTELPASPAVVTSLALDEAGTLVALLESGERVAWPLGAVAWQPGATQPAAVAAPCPPSLSALAPTTNPPDDVSLCISYLGRGADCDLRLAYVLDGDGRVWQWANANCALGLLGTALVTFVASGLVYLLLSALAAMAWLRRRERVGR